jgi:hypothetical protein
VRTILTAALNLVRTLFRSTARLLIALMLVMIAKGTKSDFPIAGDDRRGSDCAIGEVDDDPSESGRGGNGELVREGNWLSGTARRVKRSDRWRMADLERIKLGTTVSH